ncbi:DinB family protein [Crocinitomix catalasitica]|uniref:DinB family protein n=1 Tax=Crocinitomix catalasitica TaxID=184607 RepID=UPI0004822266|nr:DinB family protein [Crocinitomix catalasitica]
MQKNAMLVALMDEYRRSTIDLKSILSGVNQDLFEKITDKQATDPDCKSIETICFHIIQSGYTYANYINSIFEKNVWIEYNEKIVTPAKVIQELNKMLNFTEQAFEEFWDKSNEEIELFKIQSRWNVSYDIEQLMEHAIVHILRHRRQIENRINR